MSREIKELFLLKNEEINNATAKSYRQYFCGDLKRPQILDFIHTEGLEIGTSDYRVFTADAPHHHTDTADMIYILEGEFRVRILADGQELILHGGDFISVPPMTSYASKAAAGTRTLFIKTTKGNDKIDVPVDEQLAKWLTEEI